MRNARCAGNPKHEARNPKQIQSTKKKTTETAITVSVISSYGIRICFGLSGSAGSKERASDFGFPR
jgi:hypothetical protein